MTTNNLPASDVPTSDLTASDPTRSSRPVPAATGQLRLSVVGCGYLGATHAACMAELGFDVVGLDVDPAKVADLAGGSVPFFEPGLPELVTRHVTAGRLTFTTDPAAIADADVHFIGVGTPQAPGSTAADMTYVHAAVDTVVAHAKVGSVVVGKSTVPVGTANAIADRLAAQRPDLELVWSPEFLREGFAVADTLHPDRLVIGTSPHTSGRGEQALRTVYAAPIAAGSPFLVTDYPTAELVKVAANSFLAMKISFINAVAEVCEASGADVTAVADAIGHDARIGHRFLGAGVGFGGGCLPKDIRAFAARAAELGVNSIPQMLAQVDRVNLDRRTRVVDLVRDAAGGQLAGVKVAALGAAFKPKSDDIRDSPALAVTTALHAEGAGVVVYDPEALDNVAASAPQLGRADTLQECLTGADVVVLLTEWDEFTDLDPHRAAALVARPVVVDGRNALDHARWARAGWDVSAPGRPATARQAPAVQAGARDVAAVPLVS